MATLVVYDYIITQDQEVEYIHDARWSPPKVIFLLNRYFIFVVTTFTTLNLVVKDPGPDFCLVSIRFVAIAGMFVFGIVSLSLVLRVHAFWNRNKILLMCLLVFWFAMFMSGLVNTIISMDDMLIYPKFAPGTPTGCFVSPPSNFWRPYVTSLLFDAVILALTVIRAKILGAGSKTPVITHLYRTGVGYFLVMCASMMLSAFVSPTELAPVLLPSGIMTVMTSLMGSRMLLLTRSTLQEHQEPLIGLSNIEMSAVEGASQPVLPPMRSTHLDYDIITRLGTFS